MLKNAILDAKLCIFLEISKNLPEGMDTESGNFCIDALRFKKGWEDVGSRRWEELGGVGRN